MSDFPWWLKHNDRRVGVDRRRENMQDMVTRYRVLYNRAVLSGVAVVCVFTLGLIAGMAVVR